MRNSFIFIPLFFCILYSCDLDGVSSNQEENEIQTIDNSEASIRDIELLDSGNIENVGKLLADSISGQPNEMVFQREDGLRIEWTKKNDTRQVRENDVVMVNYHARVAGGEEYDSNEKVGAPVPLKTNIGMMVEGWEDGLEEMHEGDKARIMIPSALAYGEDGYVNIIPSHANLIIELEVVEIITPIVLEEGVKIYRWQTNEEGIQPEKNQRVTFDYFAYIKGENGHLYDNSFQNGEPYQFYLENDNLIEGIHQGVGQLREGENAFIEIPSKLAYGSKGILDLVPPNRDIVYDIRILKVE